jgi:membrane-associated phospholipid phosphatase
MARIYFDKHWFSDVIAGAMVGTASSLLIINAEKKRKTKMILFRYLLFNSKLVC